MPLEELSHAPGLAHGHILPRLLLAAGVLLGDPLLRHAWATLRRFSLHCPSPSPMAMGAEMVGRKGDFPLRVLRAPGGLRIIRALQVLAALRNTFSFDIKV